MVWVRNWEGPDLEDILLISLGKMTFTARRIWELMIWSSVGIRIEVGFGYNESSSSDSLRFSSAADPTPYYSCA